ncbi:MAG: TA system antitoxin ParD family protein [Acidimicrobiales bacterium]
MADVRMTRFDAELFEAAADEGRREHRSARQQLEHWTRLGREFSAHETAARRRIAGAVRGETPLSSLTDDERFVANVELDVAIRERAATARFGRAILKAGMTAVALDDKGVLTEFGPDGTARPLADAPAAASPSARVGALGLG